MKHPRAHHCFLISTTANPIFPCSHCISQDWVKRTLPSAHCSMSASLHYTIMNPQCQKYWTPSSLASIWLDFQSGGLLPGKVWIEPAGQAPEWSGFSSLIGFQISFVYAMAISHSLFPLIAPMMCRIATWKWATWLPREAHLDAGAKKVRGRFCNSFCEIAPQLVRDI